MAEILNHEGKPAFVVMPYDEYLAMLKKMQDAEDSEAFRKAKADLLNGEDEILPNKVTNRLMNGDNPVTAWREYREFSQKGLHEKSGVSTSMISQIESGQKTGSIKTIRKLSEALNIDVDDIVAYQKMDKES
ncbi:helix-turn-helix transcriptional regulator [Endozoicomonas sp. 8E]|uniref:helix-turn-helix domain-containing protein n=1 Tax=Endozoicomonas sp. 8E TaxID=3035692 RepID=UPI0029392256|nr:helix-turn-helix transcriptional regulator [Endozoicomonas sp. 8E]WOG26295.1 helix-turn-helix transcriptional regulator [Endozoicomonas sp. 8E]